MASMHKTPSETEIASTLSHLQLSTKVPQKPAEKPKSKPVADSWDEESSGSDTETEIEPSKASASSPRDSLEPISTISSNDLSPHPPPPTPASPTPFDFPDNVPYGATRSRGDSGVGRAGSDKRPEKTTAVAGRLIAGALGVRAPKRTDEEREYDRVMREKERKRRTEEKEREKREKEEAEARKKAVWDD
ncbi:hypothetical protein FB567DRAFT_327243 [Paraphoma chrysanthemicola]|uniref:Ubiquitin smt3 n=1 Tax=Paraphoma chrysanthemicola TaxID=798071 RepID=A0A8K0R777_9PLEO|nr:hypothetical protein FB567DRAFT_327243 [Paraphoma chrysanthemicola]